MEGKVVKAYIWSDESPFPENSYISGGTCLIHFRVIHVPVGVGGHRRIAGYILDDRFWLSALCKRYEDGSMTRIVATSLNSLQSWIIIFFFLFIDQL